MRRKKCSYYGEGYCFWHSDAGEVCGTGNNAYDGYCPMVESNRELEEYANAIIEDKAKKQEEK